MIVDPVEIERRVEQELLQLRIRRNAQRLLEVEDRGPVAEPAFLTLRERKARPIVSEAVWPVDRLQAPGGRVLLAAQYKTGKTSLIANYVRSRADGDDFMGEYIVSASSGQIVVLDFESTDRQLDSYYGDQRIRRDDKLLIVSLRGCAAAFNILDPNVRSRWAKRFKVAGATTVVWDCVRPLVDALGLDEHKDVGKLLVAFDAFLRESEAEDAVVVTHFGHTGERARGDSRILDWPDAIWKLTRQDDRPASPRFLSAYGRDVDVRESQLAFDPQTRRITVVGGSRQDARAMSALDALVDLLKAEPDLTRRKVTAMLMEQTDHPKHVIEDALKLGEQNGRLTITDGPRRAKLYRTVPVSQSVPLVSQGQRPDRVSQCPTASIEAGHSGHSDHLNQVSASVPEVPDVSRL